MERLVEELYTFKGKVEDCENDYIISVQEKLREYENAEEQGLLLRLPCKDELINILAKLVLNSEFGRCYLCSNPMKNITLDGVNNGCDGGCKYKESTTDDLLKKIIKEMQFKAEQKLKEMEDK